MLKEGVILSERYEIIARIGAGGMADVYKAQDHKLNRLVAVKVMKAEFREDTGFVQRFQKEAQAAAKLSHPNVVNVYDVGEDRGLYYIVMELVEGITLKNYIQKKGKLSVKEATSIAIQVSLGLEAAHNRGIIHRDVKPQNIMISTDGKVKLSDFGIAKAMNSNTITANVMGSVHYLSPEQAKGGYVDARTDIYSLGIVMYEMLTGKVPFDGENAVSVAMMHINSDVPAPSKLNTAVSHTMDEIVMKAAARSPEQRYSSADELIEALDAAESGIERQSEDATKIFGLNDFYAVNPNPSQNYDDGYGSDEYYEPQPDEKVHNTPVSADDLETSDETARKAAARKAARESKKKKKKKSGNRKIKALAIILALICAIPLSLLAMNAINGIGSGRVKVPDVVGMTEEQAYEALSQAGLEYELGTSVSSDKYDDGDVVSTDPSAGTKVKKGSTVVITLAKSSSDTKSKKKAVPDVRELTLSDARDTLTEQGFKVGTVSYKYDDSAEKGTVISQSPGAGTSANEGSTVSLTVSSGREEQTVEMPSITGLSESAARSAIAKAGLSVGTVSEEYSDESVGTVISQGVSPGTSVKKGESVSFVISKGKKPSESDSSSSSNSGENNSNSKEISISFGRVEREPGTKRTLVLKHPSRYIPQFMEDLADIPLVLHMGDQTKTVAIEVANIKSYTLRVKLKNAADVEGIDLEMVNSATIDARSPVFLLEELKKQFAELEYEDDFNMQENLCENIEFVFGPPGTGKTTHLAQNVLIPMMNDNQECKVLVLTPTNKSADVLVRRIMEVSGDNHDYEEWLVRFGATGDEEIEQSSVYRDKTFDIRTLSKSVTVTTIARFPYDFFMPQGARLFLHGLNWDYIVIDEASMIPIANIVFPLYKKTPRKFIIAGDPFQIEPITSVSLWKDENIYTMVQLDSFIEPVTIPHQYKVELLTTQYRSIPEIGRIFSNFAYGGILDHFRSSDSQRKLNVGDDLGLETLNIIKFPVSKYESIYRCKRLQHSSSYQVYSALFTYEYVSYLAKRIAENNSNEHFNIGVIAPYRAQADMIDKLLASEKLPEEVDVQVGTIHGFQGDECDIIFAVFNTPPSISPSKDMFLNKRNIINVSVSRARDYLFIVIW